MNHKGVCRTAPATPGLLNLYMNTVHVSTVWSIAQLLQLYRLRNSNGPVEHNENHHYREHMLETVEQQYSNDYYKDHIVATLWSKIAEIVIK